MYLQGLDEDTRFGERISFPTIAHIATLTPTDLESPGGVEQVFANIMEDLARTLRRITGNADHELIQLLIRVAQDYQPGPVHERKAALITTLRLIVNAHLVDPRHGIPQAKGKIRSLYLAAPPARIRQPALAV